MTDWNKGFLHGYICAVSVDIQNHGEGKEVDELIGCSGYTFKECIDGGVDEHDLKTIRPSFERLGLMG